MSGSEGTGAGAFARKVAIVTGAASLMGIETARQLLDAGASVLACDTEENAHYLTDLENDGRLLVLPGDVADDDYLVRAVDTAKQTFGGVDMLVTAAAIFADPGVQATQDDWRRILDVNVVSVARLINLCAPHLKSRGGGHRVVHQRAPITTRPRALSHHEGGVVGAFTKLRAGARRRPDPR